MRLLDNTQNLKNKTQLILRQLPNNIGSLFKYSYIRCDKHDQLMTVEHIKEHFKCIDINKYPFNSVLKMPSDKAIFKVSRRKLLVYSYNKARISKKILETLE